MQRIFNADGRRRSVSYMSMSGYNFCPARSTAGEAFPTRAGHTVARWCIFEWIEDLIYPHMHACAPLLYTSTCYN